MLLLGSSQYYRDNHPARNPEEATQGPGEGRLHQVWRLLREGRQDHHLKLTTFGDDATTKGQGTDLHSEHEGNRH